MTSEWKSSIATSILKMICTSLHIYKAYSRQKQRKHPKNNLEDNSRHGNISVKVELVNY